MNRSKTRPKHSNPGLAIAKIKQEILSLHQDLLGKSRSTFPTEKNSGRKKILWNSRIGRFLGLSFLVANELVFSRVLPGGANPENPPWSCPKKGGPQVGPRVVGWGAWSEALCSAPYKVGPREGPLWLEFVLAKG